MINYYNTNDGLLVNQTAACPGSWIHLLDPTKEELDIVSKECAVELDILQAALDEEETPRIDKEDEQTLILVDIPVIEPEGTSFLYNTMPLGIIITENNIITVCLEESTIIEDFYKGRVKGFDCTKKTRFVYHLLYKNSSRYLQYLRQIEKASTQVENALHKSLKNRELIQMLKLEKSLVYFATSLKANELVLEKMLKTNLIKRYPDDDELLEDVIIENKQAIEMCTIYREILTGTMDAFASVISNNLNIVMKFLTSVTIILTIPTLLASLWGMNVDVPFEHMPGGFLIVSGISLITTAVVALVLWKKKLL
ncbi:MAG: magnesium transporter CorA family protein [Christensenellales bacterium]